MTQRVIRVLVLVVALVAAVFVNAQQSCYAWPDGGDLQAAIDANPCVELPEGEFVTAGEVRVPPGATLRGAGMDLTVLRADPAFPLVFGGEGNAVIRAGGCCGAIEPTRIIEDMTIDATGSAAGNAIGWSNFSARRVRLLGGLCHGAFIAGPNAEILDSLIEANAWPRWNENLARTLDCRDAGGLEQGAGVYLPVWAPGPTLIQDTVFLDNNGSDVDCYASVKGKFIRNTTRGSQGPVGLILYQCHGWVIENSDIEAPRVGFGWGGWWCFPSSPGPGQTAAVMACLAQDVVVRNNILSGTYALTAYNDTRMVRSGNVYRGLLSVGSYSGLRNASIVSASVPSTVRAGQSFTATVRMRNTGVSMWQPGYHFLGDPADQNTVWGNHRTWLSWPVDWGGEATFAAQLRAPTRTGYYTLRLRMVEETVTWFGSTLSRSVRVIR